MRIVKEAAERKSEILDVAEGFIRNSEVLLHMEKGSMLEAMLPMFYR